MVAAGRQCASGSTITPTRYALQFLHMYQEGWGSHLGEHTARGTWSLPEAGYTWNYLTLKEFQHLWLNNIAVITTYNTTIVACMKKGGEMKSCPSMENPDLVFQETGDSSSTHSRQLNVIADKLSSLTQLDRADRMVPPVRVFQTICFWWHQP